MTQELGEIDNSQSVKAYKASIVLSEETPGASWINISTSRAVLSSIFLILIFPFSLALIMLSIKLEVVRPKGISVIFSALLLLSFSIFALILTFPPRIPSQYLLTSIIPPVGKSGYNTKSSCFRWAIQASISSLKLWGNILEARPTAIPSTPWANNKGNFIGKVMGSRLRPSYEGFQFVVLGLNTTSRANLDKRASI